jgi:excinuclease UvrABC nuclease subunit
MEDQTKPRQDWLIPYDNPLTARIGREFFLQAPRGPGVYLMLGDQGQLLYVGKAKSLRTRLNSYRRAKPGEVSRKVIRLVHRIREIRVEECESEAAALLRENQLLRERKPPFNHMGTSHESYLFIGLRVTGAHAEFRLTTNPESDGDRLYGSFKNRGLARDGYAALLRLLWATRHRPERFAYPGALSRVSPPRRYTLELDPARSADLKRFLGGSSNRLLTRLTEELLENDAIPRFYYHWIQQDLERLQAFYQLCPKRNRGLRRRYGTEGPLIAQERIDDLLVLEQVRAGRVQGAETPEES